MPPPPPPLPLHLGMYSYDTRWDYPSATLLEDLFTEKEINVIFAVENSVAELYRRLRRTFAASQVSSGARTYSHAQTLWSQHLLTEDLSCGSTVDSSGGSGGRGARGGRGAWAPLFSEAYILLYYMHICSEFPWPPLPDLHLN